MIKKAFCNLSVIPMRCEANDRSEMVSQLLFGEIVDIINMENEKWYLIVTADNYQAWVDPKQLMLISSEEALRIEKLPYFYSSDNIQFLTDKTNNKSIPIGIGARIPIEENNQFRVGNIHYHYSFPIKKFSFDNITEIALKYLEVPYLWGGKSNFGIDCSGFTQIIFRICGMEIPRDASQQANYGENVNFAEEVLPGDLAFFDNEEEEIIHVGILLSKEEIIHASGKVRIDRFDHHGIFNKEMNTYSHKLRLIKRIKSHG
jgi:hypothetical protein